MIRPLPWSLLALALWLSLGALAATGPVGQSPPRDASAAAKGTAVIRGRVVTADGQVPLRRAQIAVSGMGLQQTAVASTNSNGVYVLRNLRAGRYILTASRSGFLTLQRGQRYPEEPGVAVELRAGDEVTVDFALPRASSISGRVVDEHGAPVMGAPVLALQPRFLHRRRTLVPITSGGRTDDTGHYRITGLAPGDYVVMTVLRETWTQGTAPDVFGYAPSYYPSAASPADAQPVRLGLAQDVGAIDVTLVPGRAAAVSGTALLADGTPLAGATVGLSFDVTGSAWGTLWSAGSAKVLDDGSWSIRNVPPGEYEAHIEARDPVRGTQVASVRVSAQGADITGIALRPLATATLRGRVVTEDGQPLPGAPPILVVAESLAPGAVPALPTSPGANGRVAADGMFTFGSARPGPTLLRVGPLPSGWWVKSVTIGGRDHTEVPFEAPAGLGIGNIRVVLSRTLPSLTGRAVDATGQPAVGSILLFPTDPARWHEVAGALHLVRPDPRGAFHIAGVRPGEYFAIALDYVQTWQATDPEFLDGLRQRASRVRVVEGENESLLLRVHR
jgi:hypothetical protein